jgi:hypothetical protein
LTCDEVTDGTSQGGAKEMTNLPSRLNDALGNLADGEAALGWRSTPARVERAVREGVAVEHGRGIVQAARARAVEYVANEAMQGVAGLTELEALYLRRAPLGEERYRAIADMAAVTLANIVSEAGRAW